MNSDSRATLQALDLEAMKERWQFGYIDQPTDIGAFREAAKDVRRLIEEIDRLRAALLLREGRPTPETEVQFYRSDSAYTNAREIADADRWLDEQGVPHASENGEIYSLTGRIVKLQSSLRERRQREAETKREVNEH